MSAKQMAILMVVLVLTVGLAFANSVDAQERSSRAPLMSALDADGDGRLSADELAAASVALQGLDANGDGTLDETEIAPAWRGPVFAPQRAAMGRFGPGRIGIGFQARSRFGGRGLVGGGPWTSRPGFRVGRLWSRGFQAGAWSARRRGFVEPRGADFEGRGSGDMMERLFGRFAGDDGVLDASDVEAPMWERLSAADADADGTVSLDELRALVASRREQANEGMRGRFGRGRGGPWQQPDAEPER